MGIAEAGLGRQIKSFGRPLLFRYYTETITGSVWDDSRSVSQSGTNFYTSGLIQGPDNTEGSEDSVLIEQGRIKFDDTVFFVSGAVETTSGTRVVTVTVSGIDEVYRNITPGVGTEELQGNTVYKKIYGRFLHGGSLF